MIKKGTKVKVLVGKDKNKDSHDFLTREEEQKMMIRQLNRVVEYLECLPLSIMNMEN